MLGLLHFSLLYEITSSIHIELLKPLDHLHILINPTNREPVSVSSLHGDPPDDGQLGQGHRGQFKSVWKRDDVHPSGTLRRVVLQTLSHLLLFC